jgi:hypothetical protein
MKVITKAIKVNKRTNVLTDCKDNTIFETVTIIKLFKKEVYSKDKVKYTHYYLTKTEIFEGHEVVDRDIMGSTNYRIVNNAYKAFIN